MADFRASRPADVAVAVIAGISLILGISYVVRKRTSARQKQLPPVPKSWKPVAKVEHLTVYPVKSCRGKHVENVQVKNWAVMDGCNVDR
jgi:hypothetical protein